MVFAAVHNMTTRNSSSWMCTSKKQKPVGQLTFFCLRLWRYGTCLGPDFVVANGGWGNHDSSPENWMRL